MSNSNMQRGVTFSYLTDLGTTGPLPEACWVIAWEDTACHIEVVGVSTELIEPLVEEFDDMPDGQWWCAYTLACDDWTGTPEELIKAAKALSK